MDKNSHFVASHKYSDQIDKINEDLMNLDLNFSFNGLQVQMCWINILTDRQEWEFPKHMHSSFEFHIIPKGACKIAVEGKSMTVTGGELYIVPPGVFHSQVSMANDAAVEYALNCHLTAESEQGDAAEIIRIMRNTRVYPLKDTLRISGLFEQILDEIANKPFGYHANIRLLIYQIIMNASRIMLSSGKVVITPFPRRKVDDVRMVRIEKFIDDNITRNITLKDVARKLFLSEKQINRIVFKTKGITFHQFVLKVKMKHAMSKLHNPSFKLAEIAEALGFANSYHLSRTFKKWTGLSPNGYRKELYRQ